MPINIKCLTTAWHTPFQEACVGIKIPEGMTIDVVYVHQMNNPLTLSKYIDYCAPEPGIKTKTIFLSWYSWREHFDLLSAHFTPEHSALWDKRYCRHLQLPISPIDLTEAIRELAVDNSSPDYNVQEATEKIIDALQGLKNS